MRNKTASKKVNYTRLTAELATKAGATDNAEEKSTAGKGRGKIKIKTIAVQKRNVFEIGKRLRNRFSER